MKIRIYSVFLFTLIIAGCNSPHPNSVFNSDKLRGRYKVELSQVIAQAVKKSKPQNEAEQFGVSIAAMMLSSINIEMSFYENEKGILYLGGGLLDFANAISNEPLKNGYEFRYRVENDTILYIKESEYQKYGKMIVVKKFSDSYDFIELQVTNEKDENFALSLKKIGE